MIMAILFVSALAALAAAADHPQDGIQDKAHNHQNGLHSALSNIKEYCTAVLGASYALQVQKTQNGYLFICIKKAEGSKWLEAHK